MKKMGCRLAAAVLAVSLAAAAGGCQIGGEKVTISRGMSENEVFLIGKKSCKLPVMKLLLVNNMNLYGDCYGINLLQNEDVKVQEKFEEYIKKICIDEAAKIYSMAALADERELSLTDEQCARIQSASEACMQALSENERKALGISQGDVEELYEKYALADKLYANLIADVNLEVSDDEARVMEVRQIFVKEKEQAKKAAADLKEDMEFSTVAANYNEAEDISVTLQRGMLPQEAEQAAFSMETGDVSELIQTEDGYYIFCCDNKYDEEQTQQHKQDIVEQRRQTAFHSVYDPFVDSLSSKLNETVWKDLSIQELEQYSFGTFYEIYDTYFGEQDWTQEPELQG